MWCGLVSCAVASCHVVWCAVVWCGVLRSIVVCDLLWCVLRCGGGGIVLWSHDVRSGVLCCHVVRLFWLVEWCVGCLAGWVVWQVGLFDACLAGWGMLCGMCTLWCVVPCAVVCSLMSCLWVPMYLLPFQGRGGIVSIQYFCSRGIVGNCSSDVLAPFCLIATCAIAHASEGQAQGGRDDPQGRRGVNGEGDPVGRPEQNHNTTGGGRVGESRSLRLPTPPPQGCMCHPTAQQATLAWYSAAGRKDPARNSGHRALWQQAQSTLIFTRNCMRRRPRGRHSAGRCGEANRTDGGQRDALPPLK